MGYRNVWELKIRTNTGIIYNYIGKASEVTIYENWLLTLPYVIEIVTRKLTNEERKQIPFEQIIA